MNIDPYLRHLSTCNTVKDWSEAEQALSDMPEKFRDDGYYSALTELYDKKNTCTCGLLQIATSRKIIMFLKKDGVHFSHENISNFELLGALRFFEKLVWLKLASPSKEKS